MVYRSVVLRSSIDSRHYFQLRRNFQNSRSILFMLVSLGILFRVKILTKRRHREQIEKNNDRLRERMMEIRNSLYAIKKGEPIDEVLKDFQAVESSIMSGADKK